MSTASSVSTILRVSEVFRSLQGEGPSAGTPALFLRLQGCDVGCAWCDTKYSWDPAGGRAASLEAVWEEAAALGPAPLLVVTGGEPLQDPAIGTVLESGLARWARVEVETSGIAPPPLSHPRLHYIVSPKLPSATPRWSATWRLTREWLAEPRAIFKIVVADEADLEAFSRWRVDHGVPEERVMLMPEALTAEVLRERSAWLADVCARLGVRMSPRLQVWLWGARRGV